MNVTTPKKLSVLKFFYNKLQNRKKYYLSHDVANTFLCDNSTVLDLYDFNYNKL